MIELRNKKFRRSAAILAVIVMSCASSSTTASASEKGSKMAALPSRLQGLFSKVRTVCFGRFLIDIPSTATLVYGPAEAESDIDFFKGGSDLMPQILANRLADVEMERRLMKPVDYLKLPLFGKIIDGPRTGQKIVIGSKDRIGYTIHSYIPIENDLFVQHIDGSLPSDDVIAQFKAIALHLRPRVDDQIPAEPGMCIEGGFIPLDFEYERVTIGVRFAEFADAHLSVDAHKKQEYLQESGRLELMREQAKHAAETAGLGHVFAKTKILRHHAREIGQWQGFEISVRRPAYMKDTDSHEFRFQSLGAKHDALKPELDVRFETGMKGNEKARAKSSLTDEEALMVWDRLINTIRVRQPSDGTPSIRKPVQVPLGATIKTGEPCTQAGLWRCIEKEKINASEPRVFGNGDLMPYALVPNERGIWQKIKGTPPLRRMPTEWELVAYVDETTIAPVPPDA